MAGRVRHTGRRVLHRLSLRCVRPVAMLILGLTDISELEMCVMPRVVPYKEDDDSDEVFTINVLQPEQSQALGARLLYIQQHESLSNKYLDKIDPPSFTGKTEWATPMFSPPPWRGFHWNPYNPVGSHDNSRPCANHVNHVQWQLP